MHRVDPECVLRGLAALVLALAPSQALPAPVLRVRAGAARLAEGEHVRALEPRAGAVTLDAEQGWLESGALASVEVQWRGQCSAVVAGPAACAIERAGALALARFDSAEIEVRRGTLTLSFAGAGTVVLGAGALRARTLPGGVVELENRGAAALELRRAGEPPLAIPAWQRLRVRTAPDS